MTDLLGDAEAADRYEVYSRLALRLTYDPGKQEIRVEANLDPDRLTADHDHYHGATVGVRGTSAPDGTWLRWHPIGEPHRIILGLS